jgi:flagellar hook-basal body complex protein FliE
MSSIHGLNGIESSTSALTGAATIQGKEPAAANPFSDLFADSVKTMNALDVQARDAVEGLMTGSGVDVHQAMIATQKADLAFEMVLAVRNKAVQAYQQVMGMQF